MSIALLAPEYDIRFDPERAALNNERTPEEWTIAFVDMTIRNYHATGDLLANMNEPSAAADFHETLIEGLHRIGDAVDDRRESLLAADSIDVAGDIYAELEVLDGQFTDDLRASALALPQEALDRIVSYDGCVERLRLETLGTGS